MVEKHLNIPEALKTTVSVTRCGTLDIGILATKAHVITPLSLELVQLKVFMNG